ncbi:hypothetical protein [Bradyrhizobium sp.]|uniref:hypothetical protein n=1 Tax=Bradyrhizobium sp. TaxID=376 RepID=UPI003C411D73
MKKMIKKQLRKELIKKQRRRKAFSGSIHERAGEGTSATFRTKAEAEQEARSLTGMVRDDIGLYFSPLVAVAGEFRKRMRGA